MRLMPGRAHITVTTCTTTHTPTHHATCATPRQARARDGGAAARHPAGQGLRLGALFHPAGGGIWGGGGVKWMLEGVLLSWRVCCSAPMSAPSGGRWHAQQLCCAHFKTGKRDSRQTNSDTWNSFLACFCPCHCRIGLLPARLAPGCYTPVSTSTLPTWHHRQPAKPQSPPNNLFGVCEPLRRWTGSVLLSWQRWQYASTSTLGASSSGPPPLCSSGVSFVCSFVHVVQGPLRPTKLC